MVHSIGINLTTPIQSVPQFAELTGQTENAIRSQINEGKLDVLYLNEGKRGKPFINMLALLAKAADSAGLKLNV